jgi:hypothetical protein
MQQRCVVELLEQIGLGLCFASPLHRYTRRLVFHVCSNSWSMVFEYIDIRSKVYFHLPEKKVIAFTSSRRQVYISHVLSIH